MRRLLGWLCMGACGSSVPPAVPAPAPMTAGSAVAAGDVCAFGATTLPPPVVGRQVATASVAGPAASGSNGGFEAAAQTHERDAKLVLHKRGLSRTPRGIAGCFEALRARQPTAPSKVVVEFDVVTERGHGTLHDLHVREPKMSDAPFEACLARELGARGFPAADTEGAKTHVVNPLQDDAAPAPDAATVASWLRAYPEGTAILMYAMVDRHLQVELVTAAGLAAEATTTVEAADIARAAGELRDALAVSGGDDRGLVRVKSSTVTSLDAAVARATAIAFPVAIAAALGGIRHLVVVPTLELGTLPYALLAPYGGGRDRVVDRMSVTIAPALDDLATPPAPWRLAAGRDAIIVGDPVTPEELGLPALAGARREAEMVAARLGTTSLLGDAASETVVARDARDRALIYLASHGVADDASPLDGSFVALARDAAADGRWTAREIQHAALPAQLAVLSACRTGRGEAHAGGVLGVARAFRLAGVRRVVMSLWDVEDVGTYELMCRLLGRLADEFPAEALRQAMLEQRSRGAPPSVWAAFTVFGAPG